MLMIDDMDYYDEVINAAKKAGMFDNEELQGSLKSRLEYLDTYADHEKKGLTRCRLFKDFAPYSFAFVMEKRTQEGDYKRWFNGGLIFHGKMDSGVGFPTLSVRIGDISKAGWSVHT